MNLSLEAEPLLTVHDVARLLSVSPRTCWRWLDTGKLPAPLRLTASTVRWRRADVNLWLAQRQSGHAGE